MGLQQNLISGEKILWQGAPATGIRFQAADLLLTPFGMVFLGFSLFWEHSVLTMTQGRNMPGGFAVIFPLWGIPFILVGFHLVIGRFFWDAYARKRTTYLLTNRRALIQKEALGKKLIAVQLSTLNEVDLVERADGSGTIAFGQDVETGYGNNSRTKRAPRLEFIPQASTVHRLVEEARLKIRSEVPSVQ